MNHLKLLAVAAAVAGGVAVADSAVPPKEPARLEVSVSPAAVAPGAEARVTVRLQPIDGVKINRYPKIKLQVPASAGLVDEARAEMGNDRPPAPDQLASNYYTTVDPLELALKVAAAAPAGRHEIEGQLTYYYCVTASGFCAPARVPIKIPFAVR